MICIDASCKCFYKMLSISSSFQKLSEEEMATIDKVCKEEVNSYVLFDPEVIKGLYRRGLIYFDVPVYSDDRFKGDILISLNYWFMQ